uniref:Uncharacterized protein n=1 Tax=Anguilla anguilla TaxID=7936 RepID=A0A0E9UBM7_ANGAN
MSWRNLCDIIFTRFLVLGRVELGIITEHSLLPIVCQIMVIIS